MNTLKFLLIAFILACIALLTNGCTPARPAALSNEEVKQATENILVAINAGDYQSFSLDYSDEMKGAMTESDFNDLRTMLSETSGNYLSCGDEPALSNRETYAIYSYECEFEKEMVRVTVVFAIDGSLVEGLFFDSKALRAANP